MDNVNHAGAARPEPLPGKAPDRRALGGPIAADMTGALIRGWTRPTCVAQELALRCLFDQVQVIQDLYELDLPNGWRGMLEQHMLDDTDSEMLYQDGMDGMDGFEGDIELNMQLGLAPMKLEQWFEPFNDASVPPFVR
jgi:hypothetical protein